MTSADQVDRTSTSSVAVGEVPRNPALVAVRADHAARWLAMRWEAQEFLARVLALGSSQE